MAQFSSIFMCFLYFVFFKCTQTMIFNTNLMFNNTFLLKKAGKLGVLGASCTGLICLWMASSRLRILGNSICSWPKYRTLLHSLTLTKWKQEGNLFLCYVISFLYFANSTINTSVLLGFILTKFYTS